MVGLQSPPVLSPLERGPCFRLARLIGIRLCVLKFFSCCGLKAVADLSLGDESVPLGMGPAFPTLSSPLKDALRDHPIRRDFAKQNELKNSFETDTGTQITER